MTGAQDGYLASRNLTVHVSGDIFTINQLLNRAEIGVGVVLHPGRELDSDAVLCDRAFATQIEPGRTMAL